MDILTRYLGYEARTTRYFLLRCRELRPEQWRQQVDVGHGTVYQTLLHVIGNLEAWTDLLYERPQRARPWPPDDMATVDDFLARYDATIQDFFARAGELAEAGRFDECYTDYLDNPPTQKTFGGTLLHVLTHTTIHRSELMHLLHRLGVPDLIEGDALSWEAQRTASAQESAH